ncbi:MAG: succinate dehydrogenase cytochrome b subunit [Opitutales bacterium]|nr:succinate dehydrogenase cytochrome b subunit [Opitutales bacterium]MDP4644920.1 succinate dehydrogenase cytochrome b subunit [Opitutales bacterium]MDP4693262.1 succinate dehydrogenase cytochrome b subunit [Opitutales bacterium]MDP4776666.1 succinate dehydrogenase cytochrome b subunit [Opitutales bacterium]MDP4883436.1 succinate dehydrogenase cytochrome b subunit [Opitutales bacterium]
MCSLCCFFKSTIGRKILMALSGLVLVLFVLGHMLGNLQIFLGADVINAYAYKLHHLLPASALWGIRLFLLGTVTVHIWTAISLTLDNRKARPQGYDVKKSLQSSYGARTMRMSGIIVLAFILFHIAHYTARVVPSMEYGDASVLSPNEVPLVKHGHAVVKEGEPIMTFNVNDMMVDGFQVWWVSAFYIIATGLLCLHLSHGFSSMFQSVGLRNTLWRKRLDCLAVLYAWVIFLGFAVIPVACLAGILKEDPSGGLPGPVAAITETLHK